MAVKIEKNIVGFGVVNKDDRELDEAAEQAQSSEISNIEVNPDGAEIQGEAIEGFLTSERLKVRYTEDGESKSLFIHAGFVYDKALCDGEEFYVKRLAELFARDRAEAGIEMSMIQSSERLQDGTQPDKVLKHFFRMTASSGIMMRNPAGGKPLMGLSSAYQVIGHGVKFILQRHGLMDKSGAIVPFNQRPRYIKVGVSFLDVAEVKQACKILNLVSGEEEGEQPFDLAHSVGAAALKTTDAVEQGGANFVSLGMSCPECHEDSWNTSGSCPTCECGYSKCG